MKVIDAPYNKLIIFKDPHDGCVITGYVIGKANIKTKDGICVPLIGLNEKPIGFYCGLTESKHDQYFEDDVVYYNTRLYASIETIRKNFKYVKWLTFGDIECTLIDQYEKQVCCACKRPAPHVKPNLNDQYICEVCATLSQLDNNSH